MAEKIDNFKVKLGQLIRVKNTQKTAQEADSYMSVQVEDFDGNNERCLLFREVVISDMPKISFCLKNDLICGRLYPITLAGNEGYILKVINMGGTELLLRVSKSKLIAAEKLAKKNPEDLTKKSLMTDLMD